MVEWRQYQVARWWSFGGGPWSPADLTEGSGDAYRDGAGQVGGRRRSVLPILPHQRQPVRPESERRTAIRQTILTKASVESETSNIIKKVVMNFILK